MKVYSVTSPSVRFGARKNNSDNEKRVNQNQNKVTNGMRKVGMAFPMVLALGVTAPELSSCTNDVIAEANAYASAYAYANASANATAIVKIGGCGCHKGDADTIYVPGDTIYIPGDTVYVPKHDTVYIYDTIPGKTVHDTIYTKGDTVYVHDTIPGKTQHDTIAVHDTINVPGDTVYITKHDTIDRWNRPSLLDTINNKNIIGDIPGAPSGDKRNISEYDITREWEYNNREVGKIDLGYSSKDVLLYRTTIYDYKGNEISDGYRVFTNPKGDFTVQYKNGKTAHSPKGFFMTEVDRAENTQKQYFCWTDGDTIRVAPYSDGKFVEQFGDGGVAKGELGDNTILLRNLIGNERTDDHLVNVKLVAKRDDELVDEYNESVTK